MKKVSVLFLMLYIFTDTFAIGINVSDTTLNANSIQLNTVNVYSDFARKTISKSSNSISKISFSDIESKNSADVSSLVSFIPGVFNQNGATNTNRLIIRGIGTRSQYATTRVKIFLDNMPLTNGDGTSGVEDISPSIFNSIEVIKGPTSAFYGSGLGGAIKIKTINVKQILTARADYGSYSVFNSEITAGSIQKNISAIVFAGYNEGEGFRQNSQFSRQNLFTKFNFKSVRGNISASLLYTGLRAEIPSSLNLTDFVNTPEIAAGNWLTIQGYEQNRRILGNVSIKGDNFDTEGGNSFTVYSGRNNTIERRPFNTIIESKGIMGANEEFVLKFNKGEINLGINIFNEDYDYEYFESNLKNNGKSLNKGNQNRLEANTSISLAYNISEKVCLDAALNGNFQNIKSYSFTNYWWDYDNSKKHFSKIISPRAGINFQYSENSNLFANVSHGFSYPTFEESLDSIGRFNTEIKPENGWNFEIGIYFNNKNISTTASAYYISTYNMIVTKRLTNENFLFFNAGKTEHFGIENELTWRLSKSIRYNATQSWSVNRFLDFLDNGNNFSGMQLPGIPSFTHMSEFRWLLPNNFESVFSFRFVGPQFMTDDNLQKYTSYETADIAFKKTITILNTRLRASLKIKNVFNKHYASMILVNAPSFNGNAPRFYYPGEPLSFLINIGLYL